MMGKICDTRFAVALHEQPDTFELLANRVFIARKKVDGQIRPYPAQMMSIGELRGHRKKRFHRIGLKCCETQRIFYESIHNVWIAAQPIERGACRRKLSVENFLQWCLFRKTRKS